MFTLNTNRNSKFQITFAVVISAIAILTLGMARFSSASVANRSYDAVEQLRAGRSIPESSIVAREYQLGERYGVTPNNVAKAKAAREYWLGERYGQTPLSNQSYNLIEELRNNRGLAADRSYDSLEQARLSHAFTVSASGYDMIEQLRLERGTQDAYASIEDVRLTR